MISVQAIVISILCRNSTESQPVEITQLIFSQALRNFFRRVAIFTLNFPIKLPDEHSFFDNGQHPIPALPNGLSFGCFSYEKGPVLLQISGFSTEQEALGFCPTLRNALSVASLDIEHSITPSDATPVTSCEKHFDGSVPTVTPTENKALPYHLSSSVQTGMHISVLSSRVGAVLALGTASKACERLKVVLALELFSGCQFAGERSAQFIVLITALEVLVPNSSSRSKRGAVVALVKDAATKSKETNPKERGKELELLYKARNDPINEAKPVTEAQLAALRNIVRFTLKALIS